MNKIYFSAIFLFFCFCKEEKPKSGDDSVETTSSPEITQEINQESNVIAETVESDISADASETQIIVEESDQEPENPDIETMEPPAATPLEPFNVLEDLVAGNQIEEIANNLRFTEGPVWVSESNDLLFSDLRADILYKWNAEDGLSEYRNPSEQSNGLTIDPVTNDLISCEHGSRSISRAPLKGEKSIIVSSFNGNSLNSPNDCIADEEGKIYFTDPPYGLAGRPAELDFNGLFMIDTNGTLHRLAEDYSFNRPNGLAFNRNKTILYVADTANNNIVAFDVLEDGTIENGRIFTDVSFPDGIKVDQRDHLYVSSAEGIAVYKPDATLIGTIEFPLQPSNCAFGGEDMDILYVTARSSVYRLKLNTTGIR